MKFKRTITGIFVCSLTAMVILTGCGNGDYKDTVYDGHMESYTNAIDTGFAYSVAYKLAYDKKLGGEWGFRTAGSDYEHYAADYLYDVMSNIGLEDVQKVGVDVDKWQFNSASLKIKGTDIQMTPASYATSGTDKSGISAEVVDVGSGHAKDYEKLKEGVKDKIVLVGVDQMNEAWIDAPLREAYNRGAAAVISYQTGGYGQADGDTINMQDVCCDDLIPCVSIAPNQAREIKSQIKDGNDKIVLKVDNEISDDGVSYNVIGKIKGKRSDQQILVAAHYDKYFYGFQDDSCGAAFVLAMARAMLDSGYEPENDIVFVLHGAEEWGTSGSQQDWALGSYEMINSAHPEWAGKTLALVNCEMPAYEESARKYYYSAVPELFTFCSDFTASSGFMDYVNTDIYAGGIVDEAVEGTTMEDGVSYRFAGVPYICNMRSDESTKWILNNYHTQNDNKSTYSRDAMIMSLELYGGIAIELDQNPALELDFTRTVAQLRDSFNEDYAEKSGVNVGEYIESLDSMERAAADLKEDVDDLNRDYADAYKACDDARMTELRLKGKRLNKKQLTMYKTISRSCYAIEGSLYVVIAHEGYNDSLDVLYKIEKKASNGGRLGVKRNAYNLNALSDYNYYIFSKKTAKEELDMLFSDTMNWGTGVTIPITNTGKAYTLVMDKEYDKAVAIYNREINTTLTRLSECLKREMVVMGEFADTFGD